MAKIIRAAVIGCGRIGAFTTQETKRKLLPAHLPINHCEAITGINGLKLIAVCDVNEQLALKAAELYNVENAYTDFKKMILEQKPDIVTIATRTEYRPEIIIFAAQNGIKGIYAEKPLSRTVSEAEKALKAVKKNRAVISYGTTRRFASTYRYAKKIIQSGKLGKVQQIIIGFENGLLMWTHPHSVDLILYFTDNADVDHVQAIAKIDKSTISKNKIDADPIIKSGLIKFKNGVSAIIAETCDQSIKLICEKGVITISKNDNLFELITENKRYAANKLKKIRELSGTQTAINEIKNSILGGKPPSISPSEILNGQKILIALASSAVNDGKKIKIPDINKNLSVTGKINDLYA